MCSHEPECPSSDRPDRQAAVPVSSQPSQGWTLLCNGVVVFEDTGEVFPDGSCLAPAGCGRSV